MTHRDAFLSRWTHLFQHQEFEEFVESTDSLLRGHVTEDCESIAQKDKELSDLKAVLAQKDEALREIVDHGELWKVDPHNPERNHMERWLCLSNLAKAALSAAPRDETCATPNLSPIDITAASILAEREKDLTCGPIAPCPDCKAKEGE